MAFDSVLNAGARSAVEAPALREDFRRAERLVFLVGASALGACIGFGAAIAMGRAELWMVILVSAPVLALALHLSAETLREALRRDAYGCAIASMLHVSALLAWPFMSLFIPFGSANFFVAPAAALGTLVLFASCWGGSSRAVYRMSAQGALVGAVAAHQGFMVLMG